MADNAAKSVIYVKRCICHDECPVHPRLPTEGRCRGCDKTFAIPSRPGMRPKYCDECRDAGIPDRDRQRAQRARRIKSREL